MIKLSDLFDIKYGINMELNRLEIVEKHDGDTVNFVSRTDRNNGVSAIVKKIRGKEPQSVGTISVASGGSPLASFLQPEPYYSGRDLYILTERRTMKDIEKIYYCMCIKHNRYKYSYGRQANRTLKDIKLPETIPDWVYETNMPDYSKISKPFNNQNIIIDTMNWKYFKIGELFNINIGKGPSLYYAQKNKGATPYVTSTMNNNGLQEYTNKEPTFPGNVLTVAKDGSVAETFYQEKPFCSNTHINVLEPLQRLNPYIGLFIATIIKKEKYRFGFGRAWGLNRMINHKIKLPVDKNGNPNWQYMEDYIKSLPYSKMLNNTV